MKIVLVILTLILIISCGDMPPPNREKKVINILISYSECRAVPSGTLTQHSGCPGIEGSWNNYEVKIAADGTTIDSIDLWCGGSDVEHPKSQMEYDQGIVDSQYDSKSDFQIGSNCASGSKINNSDLTQIINIWQKH